MKDNELAPSAEDEVGPNQYRCDCCGMIYEKGWTDEEAAAETKEVFGVEHGDDDAVVCDTCFKMMGFGV